MQKKKSASCPKKSQLRNVGIGQADETERRMTS